MAKYSIEDTTLINIADAIREKNTGKIRINEVVVGTDTSKTHNATGFDSYNGSYNNNLGVSDTVRIPGATKIKVKIAYQTESTNYDYVIITPGVGDATAKLGGTTRKEEEFEFPGTDTVTFKFISDSSNGSYLGYYAEITGVEEEEIDLGISEYFPAEMAEAIRAIEGGGAAAEIEWHYVIGDSTFLSQLKANVENLDDLVCLIAGPGSTNSGYPFIYTKGDNSRDGNILYCSVYVNSKWNGYAVGETTTTIDVDTGAVKRSNSNVSYGTNLQRYVYGVQKASTPGGGNTDVGSIKMPEITQNSSGGSSYSPNDYQVFDVTNATTMKFKYDYNCYSTYYYNAGYLSAYLGYGTRLDGGKYVSNQVDSSSEMKTILSGQTSNVSGVEVTLDVSNYTTMAFWFWFDKSSSGSNATGSIRIYDIEIN